MNFLSPISSQYCIWPLNPSSNPWVHYFNLISWSKNYSSIKFFSLALHFSVYWRKLHRCFCPPKSSLNLPQPPILFCSHPYPTTTNVITFKYKFGSSKWKCMVKSNCVSGSYDPCLPLQVFTGYNITLIDSLGLYSIASTYAPIQWRRIFPQVIHLKLLYVSLARKIIVLITQWGL